MIQAGPSLARRLTAVGMTVAFVERKLFGGTCVNTGCTPTVSEFIPVMLGEALTADYAERKSGFLSVSSAA